MEGWLLYGNGWVGRAVKPAGFISTEVNLHCGGLKTTHIIPVYSGPLQRPCGCFPPTKVPGGGFGDLHVALCMVQFTLVPHAPPPSRTPQVSPESEIPTCLRRSSGAGTTLKVLRERLSAFQKLLCPGQGVRGLCLPSAAEESEEPVEGLAKLEG